MILAKALAAGYPLSAVVGRSEIMDAPGPSAIGGTYVGNPVACAAAIAVLDVIEEEGLIERADVVGKAIRTRWEQLAVDIPEVGDVRGLGSMIGVEMVSDRETKEPDGAYVGRLMAETLAARPHHRVVRRVSQRPASSAAARDHRRAARGGAGRAGRLRARGASDVSMDADERPVGEPVGTTPARRPARVAARRDGSSRSSRWTRRRTRPGLFARLARRQRRGRAHVDVPGVRAVAGRSRDARRGWTCCPHRRIRCSSR